MRIEVRNTKDLKNWGENPRGISKNGFERLKSQIKRLGFYKPLMITPDGTVIGGNMRLRALISLGIKEVSVKVIEFKQQADGRYYAEMGGERQGSGTFGSIKDAMMEYSLSDNDRAGFYDNELLANTMSEFNIDWDSYSVDMYEPLPINDILDLQSRTPDIDEIDAVKSGAPKKCPHCGGDLG